MPVFSESLSIGFDDRGKPDAVLVFATNVRVGISDGSHSCLSQMMMTQTVILTHRHSQLGLPSVFLRHMSRFILLNNYNHIEILPTECRRL